MKYQHNPHLQSHSSWSPIKLLYYKKYANVIRYISDKYTVSLPSEFASTFRMVNRRHYDYSDPNYLKNKTRLVSIYTNNNDLIDYLIENENPVSIESPRNEKHYTYISDPDRTIIYRDTPWYKQYHNKIDIYATFSRPITTDDIIDIHKTAYELFKDGKWSNKEYIKRMIDRGTFRPTRSFYYSTVPTIYTNDEMSIMIFKMMHSDKFKMRVTTIITAESID